MAKWWRSRRDEQFAEHLAAAEFGEGGGGFCQREERINHRSELAFGGPFQGSDDVGAIATVAADEALLFHKDAPEIQTYIAACGCTTSHNGSAAREATKTLVEHRPADMFDDQIHAAFIGDLADGSGPMFV